jgi:cell division control protein 7
MHVWSAIDMWSAGMILLFFLTGKFPLFQSNDDVEALLEIACIVGRRRMEKVATLHCERLSEAHPVTYINSVLQPGRSPRIFHRLQQKGNLGRNS